MTESSEKDLVIVALRQRIGELVSTYETEIALIRAKFTKLSEEYEHVSKVLADQASSTDSTPALTPKEKFVPPIIKQKVEQSINV